MSDEKELSDSSLKPKPGSLSDSVAALLQVISRQEATISKQAESIDRMCVAIADLIDVSYDLLDSVVAKDESEGSAPGTMD